MVVTIFGVLIAVVGLWLLLRGTLLQMLLFVLCSSLMGGSAAIILTALGGSSVLPSNFALIFLILRCLLPADGQNAALKEAFAANRWLVLFVLYGLIGAFLFPRVFQGDLQVAPLRPIPGALFNTVPLAFSTQNLTTAFYMLGTMMAGVCAHMAVRDERAALSVARAAALIGGLHAVSGLASVVLAATPFAAFFQFFRNGTYAQLDQTSGGFVRMSGIWAEPAAFAAYSVVWLVLLTELWLRGVEQRWTGLGAMLVFLAMMLSTSTTAYVGIAGYGGLLFLRQMVYGSSIPLSRLLTLLFIAGIGLAAALSVIVAIPDLADQLGGVLAMSTVDKADSGSAAQRSLWALQGITAFLASYGVGIGPGSFRSSSILTAILGSVGLIGSLAFLAHLAKVFMPLRRSTWAPSGSLAMAVGASTSWAALGMLIPASVSAPSPDPGLLWGAFGGMALALRPAIISPQPGFRHEKVMNRQQGNSELVRTPRSLDPG